jgi:transposase-like protein
MSPARCLADLSKEFRRRTDLLKFKDIKLHTLRDVHATTLLDAAVPVHTVAKRTGKDAATLLRWRMKRKRSSAADQAVSAALAAIATGFPGK